jgi:DNA-binding LacI/PurR family transcriptional regulator
VAKRAGVSQATVSLVFNNSAQITELTRQKVLKAAQELGYVPNALARSLVSGSTRTIALVIDQKKEHLPVDANVPRLHHGISEFCRQHGYRALVEGLDNINESDAYLRLVRAQQIDGLIVANPPVDDQQLIRLIDSQFPVVVLGSARHAYQYSVNIDNYRAAKLAVQHLIALGHRRIAHIPFSDPVYSDVAERLTGYRDALEEAGIPFEPTLVKNGNYSAASSFSVTRSLLESDNKPSAIFSGNDIMAFGAKAAIHSSGLRIPHDISLVGFDDIPLAPYITPPLTTVKLPGIEQGQLAAEMLLCLMRGENVREARVTLDTPLVVRESCGAKKS